MSDMLALSADLIGKHLIGQKNANLGTVRECYLDLASGGIGYLVVEASGLIGGSGKYHPVPWNAVSYDAVSGGFHTEASKAQFKASPGYERDQLKNPVYAWHEPASAYFTSLGTAPEGGL